MFIQNLKFMKKLFTLLFAFPVGYAFCQPTITSSVVMPVGSTAYYFSSSSMQNFSAGANGANVSWDFSGIDTAKGSLAQAAVRADTTPDYSYFPAAVNYAAKAGVQFGVTSYGYGHLDATTFESYGYTTLAAMQVLTNPQKTLNFPFTYNNQFTDIFHTDDSIIYGNTTVKAEGYGTLKLPFSTFNNVLKVTTSEYYREVTDFDQNGLPSDSLMYVTQYYRWYAPNVVGPLLEFAKAKSYGIFNGQIYYSPDSLQHLYFNKTLATGVADVASFEASIYPNPVNGMLNISAETVVSNVRVMDVSGKELSTEAFDNKTVRVAMDKLHAGIYFVQIQTADNRSKTVRIIRL
jgi:hypothetical protein